jgi:hypothetical protein
LRPAFVSGTRSRRDTSTTTPSVIVGMPINTFFRLKPILVLRKKLGRLRIWNGGTTPYANGLGATCNRHYLFPIPMSIIIWSPSGLLFSIIRTLHLQSNHYPIKDTAHSHDKIITFNNRSAHLSHNDGNRFLPSLPLSGRIVALSFPDRIHCVRFCKTYVAQPYLLFFDFHSDEK